MLFVSDQPLVSVIVPAYRAEETLGGAISSALTQTYPNLEIIVCNDGSDDATSAIAHSYGDRITVIDQPNQGLPAARNNAIAAANGELIALLDSDDMFLPPHIERAVQAWQQSASARTMVSSNAYFLSRHGILPARRIYHRRAFVAPQDQRLRMLEGNIASIFSTFPRVMWEELEGFSPVMSLMEDYDFWARGVFAGWRIAYVEEPTALYRLTVGSLSSDSTGMAEYDKLLRRRLQERYGAGMSAAERERLEFSLSHDTATQYIDAAAVELAAGRTGQAARLLALASRLSPSDNRLAFKAKALRVAPPLAAAVYSRLENKRLHETSR